MGSSRTRKTSDEPFGVQDSGPQVELEDEKPSSLRVALVRIDPDVHRESAVGDPVSLETSGDRLLVIMASGQLGEVPPNLVDHVQLFARCEGRVVELETGPLGAVVEFSH